MRARKSERSFGWYTFSVMILVVSYLAGCCATVVGTDSPEGTTDRPLKGVQWELVEIGGEPVVLANDAETPHFLLQTENNKITGFAGCNRFLGTCETGDDGIRFGSIGSTRMICQDSADLETLFLQVIASADTYRISGNALGLYAADKLLARFKAKP